MNNIRQTLVFCAVVLTAAFFVIACERSSSEEPSERILARVGDKTISVNEFIRRAEYTVRPPYCSGDSYIHRKIVLNSLIAEKLLALAAGDTCPLVETQYIQRYLRGRKEQAMRQWLFYTDFYRPAAADPSSVKERLRLAGRTYDISYFSVQDEARASDIAQTLRDSSDFARIFETLTGKKEIPRREVQLSNVESRSVTEALYSGNPGKHDLIGPLNEDGSYTFIRIDGWTERIYLSDQENLQQRKDVEEQLRLVKAERGYLDFVSKVMKGRNMEFYEETFRAYVPVIAERYLKSPDEKKEAFNQTFWEKEADSQSLGDYTAVLERIFDEPLLLIDGEVWTVRRFETELISHPLVFRKRSIPQSEFAEQFKLAAADLIRDNYITEAAYKRGYDRAGPVERDYGMWRDNLAGLFQRNQWLQSRGKLEELGSSVLRVLENDLNPYIKELREKYDAEIEIDTDIFEDIVLTRTDVFVTRRGAPFPVVTPSFPIVTTYDKLDYGRKTVK